jgi:transposase-like protein
LNITLDSISKNSLQIFHQLRWNGTICCPECGSTHIYNPNPDQLHICADCRTRFSDTSGTIFHSTKLPLSKWLYAIYLFLTSTRGISSYALARYIQVSQTTAWSMLMRLRTCLHQDIKFDATDQVAIDEVYIGANWKYKPAFKKFQQATPPPAHWNLNAKDTKAYYKKQFMELAAQDKMCALGLVSLRAPKISLIYIPIKERLEFIQGQIRYHLGPIMRQMFVNKAMTVVTDQSKLYNFLDEVLDHNNRCKFDHQVCRHDESKFASPDGYSSNKLEAAFSHIKRSWRGVYTRWSRKYTQLYLDEFCYRYNHPLSSKTVITDRIKDFFRRVDPRAQVNFC